MSRPKAHKGRVGLITVNFHNTDETRNLVSSLATLPGFDLCRVIVVDNAATAATRAALNELTRGYAVEVLHSEENLFYWGGLSFAIKRCYPTVEDLPDWLIVCNNDTWIEDDDFFTKLLSYDPAGYHIVAPRIISAATGRDQNPFLRSEVGMMRRMKWKLYYSSYLLARLLMIVYWGRQMINGVRQRLGPSPNDCESRIYAPHCAFVIFSREFFRMGGRLDSSFRLFGEEITTAEIAKRIGAAVYYCPSLSIMHREHVTLSGKLTRTRYEFEREAYSHFYNQYLKAR